MSATKIFLTGATGFIGRRVLAHVARDAGLEAVALIRSPAPPAGLASGPNIRFASTSLDNPAALHEAMSGSEAVVHMAALTGRARPEEFDRVNVAGTAAMLEAARAAGVARLVFVSSIAATYADTRHYPYARSKQAAEALVGVSAIPHRIVRPTIVLGAGSPAWKPLAGLAGLPVIPIFGSGRVRVQPVDVDDIASALVALARGFGDGAAGGGAAGNVIEFGGPETITFEQLLQRMRRAIGRNAPGPVVHVPVGPFIGLLGAIEKMTGPGLPVTAGQLTSFTCDSAASESPFWLGRRASLRSLDATLADCAGIAGNAPAGSAT